jgi:CheY-like chemotaxis protein
MKSRILVVDDDARFRNLARTLLEACGYTIAAEAADGAQALAAVKRVSPDAALVDVQLPDINGLTLASHLHQTDGSLRIVLTPPIRHLPRPPRLPKAAPMRLSPRTS